MPGIVQKVSEYCWSNNFLDIFRNYFTEHGPEFIDAPDMSSGEHDLKYYGLFQNYLKIYENTLTKYVESLGFSIHDFYAEVSELQTDDNTSEHMRLFLECLLASMDYDSFYKVMLREGKKHRLLAESKVRLDAGSDSKGSSSSPTRSMKGGPEEEGLTTSAKESSGSVQVDYDSKAVSSGASDEKGSYK